MEPKTLTGNRRYRQDKTWPFDDVVVVLQVEFSRFDYVFRPWVNEWRDAMPSDLVTDVVI